MQTTGDSSLTIVDRKLAKYIRYAVTAPDRSPAQMIRFVRQLNRNLTSEEREALRRRIMRPETIQAIRNKMHGRSILACILDTR